MYVSAEMIRIFPAAHFNQIEWHTMIKTKSNKTSNLFVVIFEALFLWYFNVGMSCFQPRIMIVHMHVNVMNHFT